VSPVLVPGRWRDLSRSLIPEVTGLVTTAGRCYSGATRYPDGGGLTAAERARRQFLERLTGAGVPAGEAELLITREWAILAGENDYTTGTFQQITGRPPRPVAEFLHDYRAEFA